MYTIDVNLSKTLSGHQNPIFTVVESYDPQFIFTAGNDKGVVEWDLETGAFKRILCAVPASVYALYVIPNSTYLAIGMRNGEIWIVDIATQKLLHKLKVEQGAVFAMQSLTHKGELIAVGEEGYAYVWCMKDFQLLYRFKVSPTTIRCIALFPNEKQLLFGDKNGFVYVYDVSDYKQLFAEQIHSMPVTSLLVSETHAFSGGRDAQLMKLSQKDLHITQQITPHMFTVYDILSLPNVPILVTVSRDKTIKFWDSRDLTLLRNVGVDRGFDSHRLSINKAFWSTYRQQLITVADDKYVKIWNVSIGDKPLIE